MLVAFLALLFLPLRIWLAANVGIAPDEAYYWGWSQHLAAGYLDHPPAVAWLIRGSAMLLGDSQIGVRSPAIILGGLALPLALAVLGHQVGLTTNRIVLLTACCLLQPMGVGGGLFITPDVPLLLCWVACTAALLYAVQSGSGFVWITAGIAAGLALLCKHSAWILLASAALALCIDPKAKGCLRSPKPWIALLVALLVASPNLAWDLARGSSSLTFQLAHGLQPALMTEAPLRFAAFVGGQIGLMTPVVAWAAFRFLMRPRRALSFSGGAILWVMACTPLGVFACASLLAPSEANWPAPAHPLLLAGMLVQLPRDSSSAALYSQRPRSKRLKPSTWLGLAAVTSGLITMCAIGHLLWPLSNFPPPALEPAARLRGWHDIPKALTEDFDDGQSFVFADGYELAAALSYHLPHHPRIADGRRAAAPSCGDMILVQAPGISSPILPDWAPATKRLRFLGVHPMLRRDGQVVRSLGMWQVGCHEDLRSSAAN